MLVKIENRKLGQVINLLFPLSLKGKQSRHRTKFITLLEGRLKEVTAQEQELLKEHCHLDEEGKPQVSEDGQHWDVKDLEAFVADKTELYDEEIVIEGGDYQGMLKTLKDILSNCEVEFGGQDAVTYDYLCDVFEMD